MRILQEDGIETCMTKYMMIKWLGMKHLKKVGLLRDEPRASHMSHPKVGLEEGMKNGGHNPQIPREGRVLQAPALGHKGKFKTTIPRLYNPNLKFKLHPQGRPTSTS